MYKHRYSDPIPNSAMQGVYHAACPAQRDVRRTAARSQHLAAAPTRLSIPSGVAKEPLL
jgi:hypothetical protein